MEEALGGDARHHREALRAVVHDADVARLLEAHHPGGLLPRRHDGGDPHLVEGLPGDRRGEHGVDRAGLERQAVEDDVLRRPVAALDDEAVFVAGEAARLHAARVEAALHRGGDGGGRGPQVDEGDAAIAPDGVEVPARGRRAEDVDREARLDERHQRVRVAVEDGHTTRVAEDDAEVVLPGAAGGRGGGALGHGRAELPARADVGQRALRRRRRRELDVEGQQLGLLARHQAGADPARHAAVGAARDDRAEEVGPPRDHPLGGEGGARGARAQRAVTAGAAVEIDLPRPRELGLGERRCRVGGRSRVARVRRGRFGRCVDGGVGVGRVGAVGSASGAWGEVRGASSVAGRRASRGHRSSRAPRCRRPAGARG